MKQMYPPNIEKQQLDYQETYPATRSPTWVVDIPILPASIDFTYLSITFITPF